MTSTASENGFTTVPRLNGLVLAGGLSTRMGADKAMLSYNGKPQALHAMDLLEEFCDEVFVSVRSSDDRRFAEASVILDTLTVSGPANGILSAMKASPEKAWLVTQLARERDTREQVQRFSVRTALSSRVVWLAGIAGAGINGAAYGLILFLPQMIHALGVSTAMAPLVNAIPFVVVSAVMMAWAAHSDRTRERNWHAAIPAAIAGLALISCVVLTDPLAIMVALTIGVSRGRRITRHSPDRSMRSSRPRSMSVR